MSSPRMLNVVVASDANTFRTERRFPADISLESLKQKLELVTGISCSTIQIQLHNKDDVLVKSLKDARNGTLAECGIEDEMILHVKGDSLMATELEGDDAAAKFEITEETYDKREDSVRAWKQRQQLGRFNPDAEKIRQEKETKIVEDSKHLAAAIHIGERCEVRLTNQPPKRGVVAYVGEAHFRPGYFVGVQYDEPVGKNDGCVQGKRYFECESNYGGFVRPQDVLVGDYPELSIEDMEEI